MTILQADKDVESARIFRRDPMLTPDVQIRRPRESGNVEASPCSFGVAAARQKVVCTMCTPWASDRVLPVADRAGLGMFSREWRVFKGWSPVRVPPRAQHSPSSEGFLL
jgi:hypothetical protein